MSNSDNIKQTDNEDALRSAESALDAQITLCVGIAKTAFEHIQRRPNGSALASVDRAIDLLQSFVANAKRLSDGGRPAAHVRLTAILNDVTMARANWEKTMGVLAAADRSDAKQLTEHRSAIDTLRKVRNNESIKQGKSQAADIRKLL
jgi:Na+/phosphate symporter